MQNHVASITHSRHRDGVVGNTWNLKNRSGYSGTILASHLIPVFKCVQWCLDQRIPNHRVACLLPKRRMAPFHHTFLCHEWHAVARLATVQLRHLPVPRHLPRGNLKRDTPFKSWKEPARFSLDTAPSPGKRDATECSATVWRDRINVAVGPLVIECFRGRHWGGGNLISLLQISRPFQ